MHITTKTKRSLAAALGLLVLAVGAPAGASTALPSPSGVQAPTTDRELFKLKFVDDFDTLDTQRWARYKSLHKGGDMGIWAPSQVRVENGILKLVNEYSPTADNWLTGGVSLKGQSLTYGKVMVRMRHQAGEGTRGVALLWPDGNYWPPEIDFYETGADSPSRSRTMMTNHYNTDTAKNLLQQNTFSADFKRWHTVGVEWTPTSINYTFDGKIVRTQKGQSPRIPMHLALQTETASQAAGKGPLPTTPTHGLEIDWVAVFDYAPTPDAAQ